MSVGRVIEVRRTNIVVREGDNEYTATVRGSFHQGGDFPKVGDYVEFETINEDQAVITAVRPRKTIIVRKASDSEEEQVIVTNVDVVFIVMGADHDFNINRLERYLHLVAQSGANAVVVLNKKDVSENIDEQRNLLQQVVGTVPIITTSAITGDGLDVLSSYISSDTTAVLLGSSGSGKSTITNWLLGDLVQTTQGIREDDSRGRHTTTSRELFSLPNGGFIIDTPGMRELGLVGEDLFETEYYDQVAEIALRCRFSNCDHIKSDGCAVLQAVAEGVLTQRQVDQFHKINHEMDMRDTRVGNKAKYKQQNKKRAAQKKVALERKRLSNR